MGIFTAKCVKMLFMEDKRVRQNLSIKPQFEEAVKLFQKEMPGSMDKHIAFEMLIELGLQRAINMFNLNITRDDIQKILDK